MKMKRILSLLMAVMMMATLLAGCGNKDNSDADQPNNSQNGDAPNDVGGDQPTGGGKLTFITGSETGTYYGFGTVLAGQISDRTATTVTAIVGNGSQQNIYAMDAYEGTNLFAEGGKIDSFSTVAALYMEQVQIITLDPNIKTVADLKGKTVSIGESGSGVYFNALDVLAAYDMSVNDITPTYQKFADSTEALQDGKIDAAFIVAGAPTTAVTTLAANRKVYVVELDDEHIDKLIAASPYYSKNVISGAAKEAYGLEADATTVAVGAVIIARDDCDKWDVYNVVSGIFDSIDTLSHDKKNELSLDFAASVTAVPYHPGAAQYFSENGYTVPTK